MTAPRRPCPPACAAASSPCRSTTAPRPRGAVALALGKLPATGPAAKRIGSLLLNFGGPGAPGIPALAADPGLFAELNKRYDLVVFDPRGVGRSAPVSCGDGTGGDGTGDGGTGGGYGPAQEPADGPAAELAALRAIR
ncbi:hypothetical protein J7F03_02975 [Streptomyces sp. ISL-43]|uniref:hypothetical protein n=1 Tax=Streptomyces sp. ISL-43 TaxID=2819183 RepID=UPI001BE76D05|nr:hypothetical protein [Streptomyces sp. ISL-43]MBT2446067.1 hypothetical protein [Streptomyces sp. ISL-43]